MRVGEGFRDGGSHWFAVSVKEEKNARFRWLAVQGAWAGYGPRPLWANEQRTFLRQRVCLCCDKTCENCADCCYVAPRRTITQEGE